MTPITTSTNPRRNKNEPTPAIPSTHKINPAITPTIISARPIRTKPVLPPLPLAFATAWFA